MPGGASVLTEAGVMSDVAAIFASALRPRSRRRLARRQRGRHHVGGRSAVDPPQGRRRAHRASAEHRRSRAHRIEGRARPHDGAQPLVRSARRGQSHVRGDPCRRCAERDPDRRDDPRLAASDRTPELGGGAVDHPHPLGGHRGAARRDRGSSITRSARRQSSMTPGRSVSSSAAAEPCSAPTASARRDRARAERTSPGISTMRRAGTSGWASAPRRTDRRHPRRQLRRR